MRSTRSIMFFLLLFLTPICFAAAKGEETPAKEMLRLMDLLRNWEMIKDVELMQDLPTAEPPSNRDANVAVRKSFPGTKKEEAK